MVFLRMFDKIPWRFGVDRQRYLLLPTNFYNYNHLDFADDLKNETVIFAAHQGN